MKPPCLHGDLRQLLRRYPKGLTVSAVARHLDKDESAVRRSLHSCWGAYIAGWEEVASNRWAAIWSVVRVPPSQTKPKGKSK